MSSNGHSASATDGGTNAPTDLLIHCCGMQSLPTTSVIVYADRAEVKRVLKVRAFAGRNRVEIHVCFTTNYVILRIFKIFKGD